MKKRILLPALIAATVMLFFSCNKNKGGEADNSPPPPRVHESSRPVVESYSFNPGHSLRVNAGFTR